MFDMSVLNMEVDIGALLTDALLFTELKFNVKHLMVFSILLGIIIDIVGDHVLYEVLKNFVFKPIRYLIKLLSLASQLFVLLLIISVYTQSRQPHVQCLPPVIELAKQSCIPSESEICPKQLFVDSPLKGKELLNNLMVVFYSVVKIMVIYTIGVVSIIIINHFDDEEQKGTETSNEQQNTPTPSDTNADPFNACLSSVSSPSSSVIIINTSSTQDIADELEDHTGSEDGFYQNVSDKEDFTVVNFLSSLSDSDPSEDDQDLPRNLDNVEETCV